MRPRRTSARFCPVTPPAPSPMRSREPPATVPPRWRRWRCSRPPGSSTTPGARRRCSRVLSNRASEPRSSAVVPRSSASRSTRTAPCRECCVRSWPPIRGCTARSQTASEYPSRPRDGSGFRRWRRSSWKRCGERLPPSSRPRCGKGTSSARGCSAPCPIWKARPRGPAEGSAPEIPASPPGGRPMIGRRHRTVLTESKTTLPRTTPGACPARYPAEPPRTTVRPPK